MSVVRENVATRRPWGAFDDTALPVGVWLGGGAVLGDVSGGTMAVQVRFALEGQRTTQELFSLEELAIDFDTTAIVVNLATETMDPDWAAGIGPTGSSRSWTLPLTTKTEGGSALDGDRVRGLRGLWIGRQADPNVNAGLLFRTTNADGQTLHVLCQGYVWGPRSVSVPSGPRRPMPGMFPA